MTGHEAIKAVFGVPDDLFRALVPADSPGVQAVKKMTKMGKQAGPMQTAKQKGGVWCPTCERFHRAGASCEAPTRPGGVKSVAVPSVETP